LVGTFLPMQQVVVTLLGLLAGLRGGDGDPADAPVERGVFLSAQAVAPQESVYAPPDVLESRGGFNEGALTLEIGGRYMTDYIFRGLEVVEPAESEDAFNFQLEADLRMDLGRLPDPFFQVFTNTAEGDDISNFQVIRPAIGLEWETETFIAAVGSQSFTYPDRDDLDTSEVFLDLRINDGSFFAEEEPIIGPFIFLAYDFDRFEGFYAEGGFRRSFEFADSNARVTVEGLVAYVNDFVLFSDDPDNDGTGFSHYQVGVIAEYRLNSLLNISRRYGQWSAAGYLYYTDGIDNELAATTQLWGGGGIIFRY
jgi:hypothetical protein